MQVTDVRIRLVQSSGKLRGYATVTFDGCFVVHNIKILESADGFFLAMPVRDTVSGDRRDVAHPINSAFRAELEAKVLDAFNDVCGSSTVPVEEES